jgi:hypothetical protein
MSKGKKKKKKKIGHSSRFLPVMKQPNLMNTKAVLFA